MQGRRACSRAPREFYARGCSGRVPREHVPRVPRPCPGAGAALPSLVSHYTETSLVSISNVLNAKSCNPRAQKLCGASPTSTREDRQPTR